MKSQCLQRITLQRTNRLDDLPECQTDRGTTKTSPEGLILVCQGFELAAAAKSLKCPWRGGVSDHPATALARKRAIAQRIAMYR